MIFLILSSIFVRVSKLREAGTEQVKLKRGPGVSLLLSRSKSSCCFFVFWALSGAEEDEDPTNTLFYH